jgi:hypothetical protein
MVYIRPLRKSRRKRRPRNIHKVNRSHKLNKKLVGGLEMPLTPPPQPQQQLMNFNKLTPQMPVKPNSFMSNKNKLATANDINSLPLPPPETISQVTSDKAEKELDVKVLANEAPNADLEILRQFKVMDCNEIKQYIDKTNFTPKEKIDFIKQHVNSSKMLRNYIKEQHMGAKDIELAVEGGKYILSTVSDKMREIRDFVFSQEQDLMKDPQCKVLLDMVDAYEKAEQRKTQRSKGKSSSKKSKSKTPRNNWSAAKRRAAKLGNFAVNKAKDVGQKAYDAVNWENAKTAFSITKTAFNFTKTALYAVLTFFKFIFKKGWEFWKYVNSSPALVLLNIMFIQQIKDTICLEVGSRLGHITESNIGTWWNGLISGSDVLTTAQKQNLEAKKPKQGDDSNVGFMMSWLPTFSMQAARDYVTKNGDQIVSDGFSKVKEFGPTVIMTALNFAIPGLASIGTAKLATGLSMVFSFVLDSTQKSVAQNLKISAHISSVKSVFSALFELVNPSKCIGTMAKLQADTVEKSKILNKNKDSLTGETKILFESYLKDKEIKNYDELEDDVKIKIYNEFKTQFDRREKALKYVRLSFTDFNTAAKKINLTDENINSLKNSFRPSIIEDSPKAKVVDANATNEVYANATKVDEVESPQITEMNDTIEKYKTDWQEFTDALKISANNINTLGGKSAYYDNFKLNLNWRALLKMYLYDTNSDYISETHTKMLNQPEENKVDLTPKSNNWYLEDGVINYFKIFLKKSNRKITNKGFFLASYYVNYYDLENDVMSFLSHTVKTPDYELPHRELKDAWLYANPASALYYEKELNDHYDEQLLNLSNYIKQRKFY